MGKLRNRFRRRRPARLVFVVAALGLVWACSDDETSTSSTSNTAAGQGGSGGQGGATSQGGAGGACQMEGSCDSPPDCAEVCCDDFNCVGGTTTGNPPVCNCTSA